MGGVVVWVRELFVGLTERVSVGGQLSEEVKITSVVSQGSVLGTLLSVVYINGIWRTIEPRIRLLANE